MIHGASRATLIGVRVTQDKFVWQQHPLSGQWDQLRCNQGRSKLIQSFS